MIAAKIVLCTLIAGFLFVLVAAMVTAPGGKAR